MFTTIRNILGTAPPRHAEQNDTRQDIQRHDPEYERRKKKKQQREEDLLQGEDGATIAISALETFLNTFLKELTDKPQNSFNASSKATEQKTKETNTAQENNTPPARSGHAAQAASAYQHSAQSGQQTSLLGDLNENNADMIALDASEVRTIHALLQDIKLLKEKNIEYIHIERASSFLQSLVNAVERVKNGQSLNT